MHKGLFIPASYKTQNGNNETKRNAEMQRNRKPRLDQGLRLERGSVRGQAYWLHYRHLCFPDLQLYLEL